MADPKIKFKRSSVANKTPTLASLELGELALNTYDGKLFVRRDTGGVGIATTVITVNPWIENFGGTEIRYDGDVRLTGDIYATTIDVRDIYATGVTTSIGGFILRDPTGNNYSRNINDPNYDDNTAPPSMDEDPISAGIYADGSANFSGIVTASGGFVGGLTGNVTGNVTGNLTGTASNSSQLAGLSSGYYLNYNNFTNTPTLITNNNQLTNGAGYITTSFTSTSQLTNDVGFITSVVSGVLTATTFSGTLNGNALTATTAGYAHTAGIATVAVDAQGLTGIPNISVSNLTAQQADVNGIATFHNKVHLLDNDVLHVGGAEGQDGDLQIYHDTSNSYIKDAGTGSLRILGGNTTFKNAAETKTSATFNAASSVDLYFNNSLKLQTVAAGATVDGTMFATAFSGDGSGLTGVARTQHVNAETLVVAGVATFLGNVTIGGTLTYEDVTDIDSVGIITANQGINITGGGLQVVGIATFSNDIRANGNVIGDGSTNILGINSVTATSYYGDGSTLSNIPTSIVAGANISVSGSTGAVTITGLANTANVSADTLVVTGVSTLGVVTGATSIQATKFYGDGSSLTGISAGVNTHNVSSSTVQAGIITATSQFYPPSLTTVERDAITFISGAFIFNETENKLQMYLGGQWKNLAFELDSYSVVGL